MSAPKLNDAPFAGRYHLLRELGRGGMGTVHAAYQTDLEREVALKRILPENVGLNSAEGWFKREYRALAAIRHPGVPAVHDCGRCDDRISYFTMELIDGPSLKSALHARTFDDVEAITLAIELARILAAAHAAGVIHRDVKPANIILEAGGRVRLIDFGICYFLSRPGARHGLRSAGDTEYRTGRMEIAGSIGYTDPALFEGHPPSVQSDVFSVAVILYEMLTGRRLYDDKVGGFRPIDTGEFAPELAPVVTEIHRGSRLLPKDRPASMDEMIRGLEIARSTVIRTRSSAPPRVGRTLLLAGLSVVNLAVLIVLGTSWALGHVAPERPAPAPVLAPTTTAPAAPPTRREDADPVAADAAVEAVDEPAAIGPRLPTPPSRPRAKPHATRGAVALSQTLVEKLVAPKADALRACRKQPGALNIEFAVEAGRARLLRIEWVTYNPEDDSQKCLAQALETVDFPPRRAAGIHRLRLE